jgi:hypothetical protein
MSSLIKILGKYSFQFNSTAGVATGVTLSADEIENIGTTASGTLRLELWFTTTPWDPAGPNTGYEVAVDRLTGSSNGTLGPGQYFQNVSATVPLKQLPPPGTYYVTLVTADYTGVNLGVDDGYIDKGSYAFSKLMTVGSDGSIVSSGLTMPSLSIVSQNIV